MNRQRRAEATAAMEGEASPGLRKAKHCRKRLGVEASRLRLNHREEGIVAKDGDGDGKLRLRRRRKAKCRRG